jgi:peptidoglycan DL-endopeptidase CwlO
VPTVSDVTTPPAPTSPDVTTPHPAPAAGFEAALRSIDLRLLPSVGLSTMVAHRAGTTPAASAAPSTAAPSAVTAAGSAPTTGTAQADAGRGAAAITAGERYLGVPYVWGGTDPARGFDCSGFVQRVFADVGVSLPRVSVDQARQGTAVASLADARPGDLVFWRADGRRPNHIGIYAGDGRMLVAPRTGDVVRYQEITRTPDGIRRVL